MQAGGARGALRLRARILMCGMFALYLVLVLLGLVLYIAVGVAAR